MTETEASRIDPRRELTDALQRERAIWRDLVNEVGESRMTEPGPMGEWSFRDLATHLLGWRERTIGRLEAAAAGRAAPPPPWPTGLGDDDAINAWIHERGSARPVHDVLADVDRSYQRLADAIASLPDEIVTDADAFPWLEAHSLEEQKANLFSHLHDEHMPSVRVWHATRD
ncbi:MAG: hypothetical protein QOC97_1808 [Chloroflexota bacterium]|nr:hypothetical protein [Chloroflexota bacterium]